MLGDVATLDLLARPPKLAVPVHFVFGEQDALTAAFLSSELPGTIGAPGATAVRVGNAGHLVHFDRPDVARSMTTYLIGRRLKSAGTAFSGIARCRRVC
jgi:pimeloyl-ACP methyl ester carboxylesterase